MIYRFSSLNEECQQQVIFKYKDSIINNPLFIVVDINGQAVVMGYILLTPNTIRNAVGYNALIQRSQFWGNVDESIFCQSSCYEIIDYSFENDIRRKDILFTIFKEIESIIAKTNEIVLLWRNKGKEVDYYPINAESDIRLLNPSFAEHFACSFLDE